jgi:hypothetical protein
MKPHESEALWASGADPLVLRIAMHPEIPMSYTEAHTAPISVLLQAEVLADTLDRIAARRRLLDEHKRAHRAAQKGRRRGR